MKLTNRTVVTATLPKSQSEKWIQDDEVKGLALRVYRTSSGIGRAFVFRYSYGGKQRKINLGTAVPKEPGVQTRPGTVTLEEARRRAVTYWNQLLADDAKDPKHVRAENRTTPEQTVAEFAPTFLERYASGKKSADQMKRKLEKYIIPSLGTRRVRDLTRRDAEDLHFAITKSGKPITANRTIALLSTFWNYYEDRRDNKKPGDARPNPCAGLMKAIRNPETERKRYLSEGEMERLGDALAKAEEKGINPSAILAIRLLLLTGARKSEILTLKHEYVVPSRGVAILPDHKTRTNNNPEPKQLPLSGEALELIATAPRKEGNPYVCPGKGKGPLIGLHKIWNEIRTDAKLQDFRIHDLRHTFASVAVNSGMDLLMVGKILGHSSYQTTQRYAHLADSPVRTAVNAISGRIGSKLVPSRKAKATEAA